MLHLLVFITISLATDYFGQYFVRFSFICYHKSRTIAICYSQIYTHMPVSVKMPAVDGEIRVLH